MTKRRILSLLPLLAAPLAACGGDDPPATAEDVGADTAVDTGAAETADSGTDSGSTDSATDAPIDAPTDAPIGTAKPVVLALSGAGHDRIFGLAWDPSGNAVYATGAISDTVGADADTAFFVAKIKTDGTLDTSFGVGGVARKNVIAKKGGEVARGIVVQKSGKIVIAGTVEHAGATDDRDRDVALVRFGADGKVDSTFGTDGVAIFDLSAGELVGTTYVADSQWGLSLFSDDKLLVTARQKATGRTDTDFVAMKLTADGAKDSSFGTGGVFSLDIDNTSADPRGATILEGGAVVLSGYFRDKDSIVRPMLAKLKPEGVLDTSFGKAGVFSDIILASTTEAYGATLQGTSFVTIGYGRATSTESLDWISLRVTSAGVLDKTFGKDGIVRVDVAGQNDNGRALTTLPDQRILAVGGGRTTSTNADAMILLLGKDGAPETTFGAGGYQLHDLGGPNDFFWAAEVSPKKDLVAIGGVRGVDTTGTDDDDATIHFLVVPK